MENNNTNLIGLDLMFRGLSDTDRSAALSVLSRSRYAPRINAMPNIFAIIPTDATIEQQASIARAMLNRAAQSLGSPAEGDISSELSTHEDENQSSSPMTGDDLVNEMHTSPTRGKKAILGKLFLPIPELSSVHTIRKEMNGAIPVDLIGLLNMASSPMTGDYDDSSLIGDDLALQGGFFNRALNVIKKVNPVTMVKKVADGISSAANSGIGKMLMKAAKFVPGLGTVASAVEAGIAAYDKLSGPLSSAAGMIDKVQSGISKAESVLTPAAKAAALVASSKAVPSTVAPSVANKTVGQILNDDDHLESVLVSTFGANALDNAIMHTLAAEGDFIDDIFTDNLASAPIIAGDMVTGDWMDSAQSLVSSTLASLKSAVSKTQAAGTSAYGKILPKVSSALGTPWGKAAAGASGVAAAGLLYAGAAKLMKNKAKKAQDRLITAKIKANNEALIAENARKAAERAAAKALANAPKVTPAVRPPAAEPQGSEQGGRTFVQPGGEMMPPIPSSTSLEPQFSASPSGPDNGPVIEEVTRKFIKVPFMDGGLLALESEGNDMLKKWNEAILRINPSFTSGDFPQSSYPDFGAVFLLHGLPIDSIKFTPTSLVSRLNDEKARGFTVTSPSLTKDILGGLLEATGYGSNVPVLSVRADKSSEWKPIDLNKVLPMRDKNGELISTVNKGQLSSWVSNHAARSDKYPARTALSEARTSALLKMYMDMKGENK